MIFISTCSQDETTDIVMRELNDDVLRFNIDKPNDFAWDFHQDGFRIAHKASGREITNESLSSFYLSRTYQIPVECRSQLATYHPN